MLFGVSQSDECHSAECCGTLLIPLDLCVAVDKHNRHSNILLKNSVI
jgi:hypothetical protein